MAKKYIIPSIKVRKIETGTLMAGSELNKDNPTSGLGGDGTKTPGMGGDNDGSHPVGSKLNPWTSWGSDDEEE